MKKTYTLTDEAMKTLLATGAFRTLPEDQASALEEFLQTSFSRGNQVDIDLLRFRLGRFTNVVSLADELGVRAEILKALGVRNWRAEMGKALGAETRNSGA